MARQDKSTLIFFSPAFIFVSSIVLHQKNGCFVLVCSAMCVWYFVPVVLYLLYSPLLHSLVNNIISRELLALHVISSQILFLMLSRTRAEQFVCFGNDDYNGRQENKTSPPAFSHLSLSLSLFLPLTPHPFFRPVIYLLLYFGYRLVHIFYLFMQKICIIDITASACCR